MMRMAQVGPGDYLIDLGSGDGRVVLSAANRGARALGVDLDRHLLGVANEAAKREGVTDRATFREQNLFETDLAGATVITTYLLPDMNLKLRPKILALTPGTRVVAHDYHMGDWLPDQRETLEVPEKKVGLEGVSYVYLWHVPAQVAGRWRTEIPVAGRHVAVRVRAGAAVPGRDRARDRDREPAYAAADAAAAERRAVLHGGAGPGRPPVRYELQRARRGRRAPRHRLRLGKQRAPRGVVRRPARWPGRFHRALNGRSGRPSLQRGIIRAGRNGTGRGPVPFSHPNRIPPELRVSATPSPAVLALADGTVFRGRSIGATARRSARWCSTPR